MDKKKEAAEKKEERQENEKNAPFFKWLHKLLDTNLKVSAIPNENYNWIYK